MEADVGDELVALDPTAGSCFGFNAVATRVWKSLAEPRSFDELNAMLLEDFAVDPAECKAELKGLLDDMISKKLIEQIP